MQVFLNSGAAVPNNQFVRKSVRCPVSSAVYGQFGLDSEPSIEILGIDLVVLGLWLPPLLPLCCDFPGKVEKKTSQWWHGTKDKTVYRLKIRHDELVY